MVVPHERAFHRYYIPEARGRARARGKLAATTAAEFVEGAERRTRQGVAAVIGP